MINGNGDVFRLYHQNEKLAISTFLNACGKYSDTSNKEYKDRWEQLGNEIRNDNYTPTHIEDFYGVREVFDGGETYIIGREKD